MVKNYKLYNEIKYVSEHGLLDSFRYSSEQFFNVINEAKKHKDMFEGFDRELLDTDIGEKDIYENKEVYLDIPLINEAEYNGQDVDLNKPKRGGNKAYYVYVKNDKGNVIKVEFGSSMRAKVEDSEARKNYDARHGCSKGKHNDKTKPGYWSCRLPKFWSSLSNNGKDINAWW